MPVHTHISERGPLHTLFMLLLFLLRSLRMVFSALANSSIPVISYVTNLQRCGPNLVKISQNLVRIQIKGGFFYFLVPLSRYVCYLFISLFNLPLSPGRWQDDNDRHRPTGRRRCIQGVYTTVPSR